MTVEQAKQHTLRANELATARVVRLTQINGQACIDSTVAWLNALAAMCPRKPRA